MEANPGKFQGIAVGTKTQSCTPTFQIKGADIACTPEVKLLGVTIDSSLKFDSHISELCRKAARQINVLRRIGRYLPLACRRVIYQSFILSNFNFCPVIWHLCSEANTKKMELLNFRALRHVYRDYTSDYEALLQRDESVSLQLSRQRQIAIEVFKIVHKMCPKYLEGLIPGNLKDCGYNLRYSNIDLPDFSKVTYGKRSFSFIGASIWNSLPQCIRDVEILSQFKSLVKTWNGATCKCSMCR